MFPFFTVIWSNRQAHTILRELMNLQRWKCKNREHLGTLRVYWKSLKYWIQLFNHLLYATLCFTYHTPFQIISIRSFLATTISFTCISLEPRLRRAGLAGKGEEVNFFPSPPLNYLEFNRIAEETSAVSEGIKIYPIQPPTRLTENTFSCRMCNREET